MGRPTPWRGIGEDDAGQVAEVTGTARGQTEVQAERQTQHGSTPAAEGPVTGPQKPKRVNRRFEPCARRQSTLTSDEQSSQDSRRARHSDRMGWFRRQLSDIAEGVS